MPNPEIPTAPAFAAAISKAPLYLYFFFVSLSFSKTDSSCFLLFRSLSANEISIFDSFRNQCALKSFELAFVKLRNSDWVAIATCSVIPLLFYLGFPLFHCRILAYGLKIEFSQFFLPEEILSSR